jgi:hypothetical protein
MIWVLRAFILEKTNLISKFKRHDPNVNTDRRIRRGPARCNRNDKKI